MSDHNVIPAAVLHSLMRVIEARKTALPEDSYVARLLQGGDQRIVAKVIEEAHELAEAADESGVERSNHAVCEAADLLFHTLVLIGWANVSLADVEIELARRFGTGGLREQALRSETS